MRLPSQRRRKFVILLVTAFLLLFCSVLLVLAKGVQSPKELRLGKKDVWLVGTTRHPHNDRRYADGESKCLSLCEIQFYEEKKCAAGRIVAVPEAH